MIRYFWIPWLYKTVSWVVSVFITIIWLFFYIAVYQEIFDLFLPPLPYVPVDSVYSFFCSGKLAHNIPRTLLNNSFIPMSSIWMIFKKFTNFAFTSRGISRCLSLVIIDLNNAFGSVAFIVSLLYSKASKSHKDVFKPSTLEKSGFHNVYFCSNPSTVSNFEQLVDKRSNNSWMLRVFLRIKPEFEYAGKTWMRISKCCCADSWYWLAIAFEELNSSKLYSSSLMETGCFFSMWRPNAKSNAKAIW